MPCNNSVTKQALSIPALQNPFKSLPAHLMPNIFVHLKPLQAHNLALTCKDMKKNFLELSPSSLKCMNALGKESGIEIKKEDKRVKFKLTDEIKQLSQHRITAKFRFCKIPLLFAQEKDPKYRLIAASHSNCPKHILKQLALDPDPQVRQMLASNIATPKSVLKLLAKDENLKVKENLLLNINITPEILHILSQDEDEEIKADVARDSLTSPETLALLSKESSIPILINVASHMNTSTEVVNELAQKYADADTILAGNIASNPKLSESNLKLFLGNTNSYIRGQAIRNPSIDIETLTLFAKTEMQYDILKGIASHRKVTTDILKILSERADTIDRFNEVLQVIASHSKTDLSLAKRLAQHSSYHVREQALNHPKAHKFDTELLWKLAKDPDVKVLGNLASKPFIPLEIVNYLAKPTHMKMSSFYEENVSVSLAIHPKCSAEMAAEFSQPSRHRYVRNIICRNPLLTHNRMRELFNEQGLDIAGKTNLARNRNLPTDLIEQIIESKRYDKVEALVNFNQTLTNEQLVRILQIDFNDSFQNLNSQILEHPNLSYRTLEEMFLHGNFDRKCAIARSKKTPPEMLLQLAQDDDFAIRDAVFKRQYLPTELLPLKRKHEAELD